MKDSVRKVSVSLPLAVIELLLGLLLLINPVGFTSVVIIVAGALLALLGAWNLYRYIRLPREEAAKTWRLSTGAGLMVLGISAVCNQHWLVQILGTLTALYAIILTVSAFMKLQIAVDAMRSTRPFWYLMAVSFLFSAVQATLLFINPFAENVVWIFNGILLIVLALLDGAYFFLGSSRSPAKKTA